MITHQDIYTKFMIEYDKANITSSYPSLTEYEVATVLDKAYNALIAQKITGNNVRGAMFESDIKSIMDIEPLIKRHSITLTQDTDVKNAKNGTLPTDMLYFIKAYTTLTIPSEAPNPMDSEKVRDLPISLIPHEVASKFYSTASNLPWIKNPVCFIENGIIHVVHDPIKTPDNTCSVVYVKQPNAFAKDLTNPPSGWTSYFSWTGTVPSEYIFECNSTVAEELISLAVAFALENVESTRLNSKLNMRGLEA